MSGSQRSARDELCDESDLLKPFLLYLLGLGLHFCQSPMRCRWQMVAVVAKVVVTCFDHWIVAEGHHQGLSVACGLYTIAAEEAQPVS